MVPGPVLSKSVRKELLPVSTSPPPGLEVFESGFRSDGNALVIALAGPESSWRRRRTTTNPTIAATIPQPPRASHIGLSRSSSMKLFDGGGGAGFLAAGLVVSGFDAVVGAGDGAGAGVG